jgi:signal transduction histidine kinase
MSFTFEARTLLELGKELISTDEVALYELIKNAVDAGSERVEIIITVHLSHTEYRNAKNMIEAEESRPAVRRALEGALIDPAAPAAIRLLAALAESDSRSEFSDALGEWYADANTVEVKDTGEGMSLDDLSNVFLRIGTKSRHDENRVGARNLGDKGIGRLSAMRLGDRLQVKTSRAGERYWNLLDIDWTLFGHDSRLRVEEIEIDPEIGDEKHRRDESGTTIRISGLRSDWDAATFSDLLQGRIARMIDPFVPGLASRLIVARHNGTRIQVPSIPTELLDAAHAYCHLDFTLEDGEPILNGHIDYRYRHRNLTIDQRGAQVASLAQTTVKRRAKRGHAAFKLMPVRQSVFAELGPFSCDIYWFNRRVVEAVDSLTSNAAETRREISHWSGGPMLYRFGFRILPYGDPGNDWLELDENAFGSRGFKLNRQQILGRVLLQTPHAVLGEQTNREGLVQSEASDALRKILMWAIDNEMRGLINEADDIEQMERRAAETDTTKISKVRLRVSSALAAVREEIGVESETIDELAKSVNKLGEQSAQLVRRMEAVITEADEEREKFVYLAGIGLMTEFIFHELERAVGHTMDLLSRGSLKQATIESLKEQLKTLHKRIAAFDELTGEKRQSKSTFDIAELVDDILSNHAREFERHGIRPIFTRPSAPMPVKAVKGMVIQILENLIVNSAYWLKQQKRFEAAFEPELRVVLDADEKTLTVEDNGPGIPVDRADRIFAPFMTTKPVGQGRGLGLYISRDLAQYHKWKLHLDEEVGRIRAGRINMFVLDMG